MLAIAGQTAGPNKLNYFVGTLEFPGGNIGKTNIDIFFFKNSTFFLKIEIFFHK